MSVQFLNIVKQGFKMSKMTSTIFHREHKFLRGMTHVLKHLPQAMKEMDGYGWQAANALNTVADYTALALHQFKSDHLRDRANKRMGKVYTISGRVNWQLKHKISFGHLRKWILGTVCIDRIRIQNVE